VTEPAIRRKPSQFVHRLHHQVFGGTTSIFNVSPRYLEKSGALSHPAMARRSIDHSSNGWGEGVAGQN